MKKNKTYIAFLRGINVGGHHKVPMAELKIVLSKMGFENIITILNSGNVIFSSTPKKTELLEKTISVELEKAFSFAIPIVIRSAEDILTTIESNPFEKFELTKDKRFYISFLKKDELPELKLPWTSEDSSFKIIEIKDAIKKLSI